MKLAELAAKYHTDKLLDPQNRYSHDYIPFYEKLLEGRTIKKVLEIGIGYAGLVHVDYPSGASLRMWAEYFPEAEIYGLDIYPGALVNEGRIHSYQCDQSNIPSLVAASLRVGEGIDFIVDDGSHVASDQILTARVFMPLLSKGGVYVIEDVYPGGQLTSYLPFRHRMVEFRTHAVENDRVAVIER